ncbi:hypothetical protein [Nocardia bovistercoris]|uniref:Glyoxalase n=1 Tax=Nocardia bovistercoris TaxID=2785916 RepID=A0A931N2R5_9NOCA|nr:hypothetical protein [Nocardia bovistercoris]MBH0776331.1 hypothetical protein [Nocardia bovistercoris]
MIFHVSIPADDTERVAKVIAEIWGGKAFPFPPWPGAWIAMAGDDRSTTCEVYPRSQTMAPGEGPDGAVGPLLDESPSKYVAFHFATATNKTQEEVVAIGEREGWRVVRSPRGELFDVIEFWVEDRLHVEVLTAEMQADYLKNVNYEMWH